jgi:hypothetical protein
MQDLERLHERTNVSLKLPEGGRLKLEPTSELKRKQRPPINFNVELTQLSDGKPATSYAIADLKDDDDLPEPHELLNSPRFANKKREPSPETSYSDSEIDSLIRHAPLDFMQDVKAASPRASKQDGNKGALKPLPLTPLRSRKRNQSSAEVPPPAKRSRFEVGTSQGFSSSPASRPEHTKVRKSSS